MILNVKSGKAWLGPFLGRNCAISDKTWKLYVSQGLPIGMIGGTPFVDTDEVERWLKERVASSIQPPPPPRRPRGRPRKYPQSMALQPA